MVGFGYQTDVLMVWGLALGKSIEHMLDHGFSLRCVEQVGSRWLMLHGMGGVFVERPLETDAAIRVELLGKLPSEEAVDHVFNLIFGHDDSYVRVWG